MDAEQRSQETVRGEGNVDLGPRGHALFLVNDSGIRVVPLPAAGSLLVGRGADTDVRVADERMSRHHARLHLGASFQIEDLHSANGTKVAGQPLIPEQRQVLNPGDAVTAGNTTMLIRSHAAFATVAFDGPPGGSSHRSLDDAAGEPVVGDAMTSVLALADRVAASLLPVLLLGETGAGKDVLAERIHGMSPRANGPFLRLNCAAFSSTLLESELFGHERGAFTGATSAKPGLLQSANGGTVLFDEIGDLSPDLQAKLLIVIERREVLSVGAVRPRSIDVRFLSATNRPLVEEVQSGGFRRDLYHRLNGVTIEVPPLRARATEIEGLARRFIIDAARSIGRPPPALTSEVLATLRSYSWPGNIRELRTVIERAVLLGSGTTIERKDIILATEASAAPPARPDEALPAAGDRASAHDGDDAGSEKQRIAEVLAACGGNQSRAAKLLGISRNTLIARIVKYGLARPLLPRGRP